MQPNKALIFNYEDIKLLLEHYNFARHKDALNEIPAILFNTLTQIVKEKGFITVSYTTDEDFLFSFCNGTYKLLQTNNLLSFYKWFLEYYQICTKKLLVVGSNVETEIADICIDNKNAHELKIEENNTMKGFNFDFGPVTGDVVRISAYGLAVKNQAGEWVSYNSATNEIFNVDLLNFDASKFVYKMPVAIKDVAIGDVIIHNKIAVFVTAIEDKVIVAIDPRSGEEKRVLLTRSPFGFDYCMKLVSFLTMFDNTATADNPFGGFLPFMLMGENDSIDPMAMLIMMQLQSGETALFSNPMMMYLLMKDNGNKDALLPLMMMSQMGK